MIKSERILAVGEPTRYRDKEEGGVLHASGKGNVRGIQCGAAAPQGATSTPEHLHRTAPGCWGKGL